MQNFLKMAESLANSAKTENRKQKQTFDFMKMLPDIDEDMSELQPFVFTSTDELAVDVPKAEDCILACPFELFSIELEDIALTCTDIYDQNDYGVNIQAIICKELSPAKYIFWTYNKISFSDGTQKFVITKATEDKCIFEDRISYDRDIYDSCVDIVTTYLERLHNEKMGAFDASGRAKIKVNGKKAIYKPKGVIYVTQKSGKKYRSKILAQGSKNINWDHAWTVRRHWRKLKNSESLGKNRLGERCEKGYTFIGSYNKGEGTEIQKIRRVKF